MAAATLLSPASTFNNHNHALPQYPQAPPPHSQSLSSILTQNGSRRESNEPETTSQRQSLPSISDIFQQVKTSPYSPTTPTTFNGPQGLPPPPAFGGSTGPTRFENSQENRVGHLQDDKYSRFAPRAEGPPLSHTKSSYTYNEPRDHGKALDRGSDPSVAAPPPPPRMPYHQSAQLPPGQIPLPPAPPVSPRHGGLSPPQYDHQRSQSQREDDFGIGGRRYDSNSLNRHFEAWSVAEGLGKVGIPP
jgi:hypothetical protein